MQQQLLKGLKKREFEIVLLKGSSDQGCQVQKKAKFGHKLFRKGQILKCKKGLLFDNNFNIQKGPKMVQTFYFWQTVSKKPNSADLAFLNAKWQPCLRSHAIVPWFGSGKRSDKSCWDFLIEVFCNNKQF